MTSASTFSLQYKSLLEFDTHLNKTTVTMSKPSFRWAKHTLPNDVPNTGETIYFLLRLAVFICIAQYLGETICLTY